MMLADTITPGSQKVAKHGLHRRRSPWRTPYGLRTDSVRTPYGPRQESCAVWGPKDKMRAPRTRCSEYMDSVDFAHQASQ